MNIINVLTVILLLTSCSNSPQDEVEYDPTPLPIMLEQLSEDELKWIRDSHETDTSTYLIDTRPVLFQIQGVENAQDQQRGPIQIRKPVEVMIYAFAEQKDGALVDYGWIENGETGEKIWEMNMATSVHGGGEERNRKFASFITLPPGLYSLRYVSNESHANKDWEGIAPEREFYYGITVYNLKAIESFKKSYSPK